MGVISLCMMSGAALSRSALSFTTVSPSEPGSAFVPYVGRPLADVLCLQEDRVVGADNCVSYKRRSLQIPPQRHRQHYVRATVRVHEYPDGWLAIFDGPRCLARFDPK